MSNDAEKLSLIHELLENSNGQETGEAIARKINNILAEPDVTHIYVTKLGYGTLSVDGKLSAVVPLSILQQNTAHLAATAKSAADTMIRDQPNGAN